VFATLTSKGQITLPKEIRDRLGLDAGSMLDFQLLADNTITFRPVKPDARRLRCLLKSPHPAPVTVEQMDTAVSGPLRHKHLPVATRRKTSGR
jgi:AbrB family looped-hinge helix DNA binding protein